MLRPVVMYRTWRACKYDVDFYVHCAHMNKYKISPTTQHQYNNLSDVVFTHSDCRFTRLSNWLSYMCVRWLLEIFLKQTQRHTNSKIAIDEVHTLLLWFIRPVTSSEEAFNQSMNHWADQHKYKINNTEVLCHWEISIKIWFNI